VSLESSLERKVCADLAFQGFSTVKVGFDGWPDRLVLLGKGRHVWFEFKTKKGILRASQRVRIRQLERDGELVYVIRSEQEAVRAIAEAVGLL
jgi:hypothetical protein